MRALVTGGAGFIAAHIAQALLDRGDEVLVVDNLVTGRRDRVPAGADFAEVDVTDQAAMRKVWQDFKPEVVDHHAAQIDVRKSVENPAYDAEVNVLGSLNVIKNSVDAGTRKIVFASTGGAMYGEGVPLPAAETLTPRPISLYGTAKYCVEQYLGTYGRLEDFDYTVLRYSNVYGPGQRTDGEAGVVAIFAGLMLQGKQPVIFGQGDKTRDYVYVGDVVRANLLAIDATGKNGPYNIGTGVQTTDQEVFDTVAAACGYDGKPNYLDERKGEIRHVSLDASLAHDVLDWDAQMPFAEGIAATVDFVREIGADKV